MRPPRPPSRGYDTGRALGVELPARLLRALAPCPDALAWTWWENVKRSGGGSPRVPGEGVSGLVPLATFAEHLSRAAAEHRPKTSARVVVPGFSLWGGSADAQCTRLDCAWFDCDGGGDWLGLLAALDALGIAYVAQRSGGHSPALAKWHLHIPLASPLLPPTCPADADPDASPASAWIKHERAVREWKRHFTDQYEWLAGLLGALAGDLPHDWHDDAVGRRLFQPCYPSSRRTPDAAVNEPVYRPGRALDWPAALAATGYTPSPLTQPRTERIESPLTAHAWLEALALDGFVRAPASGGKWLLRCPWEHLHSTPGGTGTVLMRDGRFHCSHASHGFRTNRDVFTCLSPEAQRIVTGERDSAGVERVRRRLAEHAAEGGAVVSLGDVAATVDRVLTAHRPGALTVIAASPGSGKNRGVNAHVVHRPVALVVAPSHELCAQHADNIRAHTIAPVQHRRGVLHFRGPDGAPLCAHHDAASVVQSAGGDVGALVCRTCPDRRGCPARKAAGEDGGSSIVVTVPQLADSARKSLARLLGDDVPLSHVLTVYDEGVTLFDVRRHTVEALSAALAALDADAALPPARRVWNTYRVEPVAHVIGVLLCSYGGRVALDAAALSWERVRGRLRSMPRGVAPLPGALDGAVSQYLRDPLGFEGGLRDDEGAPSLAGDPERAAEVARTLSVVLSIGDLALTLDARGAAALEWGADGCLVVRGLTAAARDLQAHGGVVTDATPRDWELVALHPRPDVLRLDVPDRSVSERTIVYRDTSRKRLCGPDGAVAWDLVDNAIRDCLSRCRPGDRVLFVTYKAIADGLRAGVLPVEWPVWDVAHYGAVRGSNAWETWEVCATIGDDRANVGAAQADLFACADRCGLSPSAIPPEFVDRALRDAAEGGLLQAHARLRDPSRTTPARHYHYGTLVPLGWNHYNATVEYRSAFRPDGPADNGILEALSHIGARVA